MPRIISLAVLAAMGASMFPTALAQEAMPQINIKADAPVGHVSPILYGLMTEEINHSYDGGLYAELIINRSFDFKEFPGDSNPEHWRLVGDFGGSSIAIDNAQPLNEVRTNSLRLDARNIAAGGAAGIANDGWWGIPVKPDTRYHASFYARTEGLSAGPLTVSIVNAQNGTVYASERISGVGGPWKKYEAFLKTGNVPESKNNLFEITTSRPGTIWFSMVSLFPPTYHHRPNGNREDIMQLLADMKPGFLRFPGGNYLEGNTIETRFDWKKTVGDIAQRPGHLDDAWRYWSTDGMGLLEFLEWCEDLDMQPVLAVYAGYSLRQVHVDPGPDLQPYVQEALDEIDYVTGGADTKWGMQRIRDGHAAPFELNYVEIGNEDNFDRSGSYDGRYTQFYDAIKAQHPRLQLIATTRVRSRTPDMVDDHFYRSAVQFERDARHYDNRDRNAPKVFVGEWATREGSPTPNMNGALGDGVWMTCMERNSDVVTIASYAPLFVNVSPGAMQWATDLIGYDALHAYGSPSYYAQKMFNLYRGDEILAVAGQDIPRRQAPPEPRRGRGAVANTSAPAQPVMIPALFYDATLDSKSGKIFLKVVNPDSRPYTVRINVTGAKSVDSTGETVVLSAEKSTDSNSITEPMKITPLTSQVDDLGASSMRTLAPYSITVLVMGSH